MASRQKPVCKYGIKCYRKNPNHLKNYSHPKKIDKEEEGCVVDTNLITRSNEGSDSEVERQKVKRELKNETKGTDRLLKKRRTEEPEYHEDDVDGKSKEGTNRYEAINEGSESISDEEQAPSPECAKEYIKLKYLVDMPDDFYQFWDFCLSFNPSDPQDALKCLKLKLVGPFDILAGKHKKMRKNRYGRQPNFLLHYRFYYDPPEFQTVLVSQESDHFHLGYFRDDPNEQPVFVAGSCPRSAMSKEKVTASGENLFAAVHIYASKMLKTATTFTKTLIQKLIKSVESAASNHNLDLQLTTKRMKERQKKVVCPSFHGAGIVVPVDENEIGYRPVPETPGDLKALFKRIAGAKTEQEKDKHMEDLQELITLVQFANDECDYGEGLELGMDLFSFGEKVFHPQISLLLPLAYQLLNRSEFASIITAHLDLRRELDECVDELICK